MVRSPMSKQQDETPLTPPQEKTEREVFSPRRESISLNRISFGGHHHSEIPQNDTDYYPNDVSERTIFRETNCDCDCDCTSDGLTGCLRRNKQCMFTITILSLTTIIILLIFRSLSYEHNGKYDVIEYREEKQWRSHSHHYNETDDEDRPINLADLSGKRMPVPILEDSREPDYYVYFRHPESKGDFRKRRKRGISMISDDWKLKMLLKLFKEHKSKYSEVLAELQHMEKAMLEHRSKFSTQSGFEPFSLTNPTTEMWSSEIDENFSDWSVEHSTTIKNGADESTTTMEIDLSDSSTVVAQTESSSTGPAGIWSFSSKSGSAEELENFIDDTTTVKGISQEGISYTDGVSYKSKEHNKETIEKLFSTDPREATVEEVQTKVKMETTTKNMTSEINEDTVKPTESSSIKGLKADAEEGKALYLHDEDGYKSLIHFDITDAEPDRKPDHRGDGTIGISLKEAKRRKLQDRKHLLLNTRVVSDASDIMYPTGPDDAKPIVNTVETSKTSQQLSLSPSAFAQYYLPYQMCFYANTLLRGKSEARESSPKTFKIEPPSFFRFPQQLDEKKKHALFHFPTQQNFLSFNINNYANPGQSSTHLPPSAGSVYALPSPHHFAPFLQSAPQPQQQPLFCTFLQPPLFQLPTFSSISETSHPKCVDCDDDFSDSKEVTFLTDKDLSCREDMVPCRDGSMCIYSINWCDNKVHCKDGSDEIYCSCRERLAVDRLCDGYMDCPNGEDETGCFGCPKSTFSCDTFDEPRACIPLSKRCDDVRDCPTGKDEADCTSLFPEIVGNSSQRVSYSKGFLHRNWKGDWYPVCVEIHSNLWANRACMEELGTYSGEPEVSFAHISENYKGPFLVRTEDDFILQDHCKSHVSTYVKCPEIRCGTRIMSEDYAESRFKRYIDSRKDDFSEWWKRIKKEIIKAYKVDDVYWKLTPVDDVDGHAKRKREETGRVVGGKDSEPRAWPWVIALYKDGDFHCGGVILDEKWIMTAAHCVEHYRNHYYEIRSGMLRRFSYSPMEQIRTVSDVIVHEKYNKSIMNNDMALLRLSKPLNFNRWVRPTCLPSFGEEGLWAPVPGTTCIAIGWGAVKEHGSNPDQMREVEVPILSKCRHIEDLEGDEICAGVAEGGKDTCQGDSGGPLLCRDSNSAWYVAGVVSHGEGCARPGEPGAYTRVSLFIDWITSNANDFQLPSVKPVATCPGFRCMSGSRRCISSRWVCNGLTDCLNGEDELNCPKRESPVGRSADDDNMVTSASDLHYDFYKEEGSGKKNERVRKNFAVSYQVKTAKIRDWTADTSTNVSKESAEDFMADADSQSSKQYSSRSDETVEMENNSPEGITAEEVSEDRSSGISQESSAGYVRSYSAPNISVPDAFQCRSIIQTVRTSFRCDGIVDCEDATDEACTCRDYLLKIKPELICNGVTDCGDLTDERRCQHCSNKEFDCMKSRQCISKFKTCDGVRDCTFGEDEAECFALTKYDKVKLDGNGTPLLRLEGRLMWRKGGKWSPYCQNGNNMRAAARGCSSLGSIGYDRYDNGSDSTASCRTLNVTCSRRLTHNLEFYKRYGEGYHWPWHAFVYSDGEKICSAALLEVNWLLAAIECVKNLSLQKNHVIAKLGTSRDLETFEFGSQFIRIDGIKRVRNSDMVLLHLRRHANVTWQVRPISLPFWFDSRSNKDICLAIGLDTIFLKSLPDCRGSFRCYARVSSDDCQIMHRHTPWSGVIVCQSEIGWYPASVFHERHNFCDFNRYFYGSVLEKVEEIKSAIEIGVRGSRELKCDGIRCREGKCVPMERVCNGIPDCTTREDEDFRLCNDVKYRKRECRHDELLCNSGLCVSKRLFGNGVNDCGDGSDEPKNKTCYEYLKLTSPERICDGVSNCFDRTDERPDLCGCTAEKFSCTRSIGVCIPRDYVCDGTRDCPEGEDEAACVGFRKVDPTGNKNEVEIIHMSYGVWHTLCSPSITQGQAADICRELGYGRAVDIYQRNQTRISPVLNGYSEVKLNSQTSVLVRKNRPFARVVEDGYCNVAIVKCE